VIKPKDKIKSGRKMATPWRNSNNVHENKWFSVQANDICTRWETGRNPEKQQKQQR